MPRSFGSIAYESNKERLRNEYAGAKRDGRCPGRCGRAPQPGKVYCKPCVIKAGQRRGGEGADDLYQPGDSRVDPETRGGHTHALERACADAYRVERYSVPDAAWQVVIYAKPLARAREHAERIAASYRASGITTYPRVRVVDAKGNEQ